MFLLELLKTQAEQPPDSETIWQLPGMPAHQWTIIQQLLQSAFRMSGACH